MKSKNGFSLLELSISLIVISIVTTAVLALIPVIYKMRDARLTAERLKVLDNAIKAYILKHEKLPLPADIKLTPSHTKFGREVSSTSDLKTIKNTIYVGTVPVFDLGLSSQYITDGYGNKFVYMVHKGCTANKIVSSNCGTSSDDLIKIKFNCDAPVLENVTYAIISNGVNGYGAYSLEFSTPNYLGETGSTSNKYASIAYDLTDGLIDYTAFEDKDASGLLSYATKEQLMVELNLRFTDCHINSGDIEDDIEKYCSSQDITWPNDLPHSIKYGKRFVSDAYEVVITSQAGYNKQKHRCVIECLPEGQLSVYFEILDHNS